MNRFLPLLLCALLPVSWTQAQDATITVTENLTAEGIPAIPVSIIDEVKNYTEARGASLADWHPKRKELLISTRFANSAQLHHVKNAGGARTQLTFFTEPVSGAIFQPITGDYFLFSKDIGGNEFGQIYRFDMATKKIQLLTDGKRSQNGSVRFNHKGDRIAYSSTKRNGQDRDIFIMNPLDPTSDKILVQNTGGGWGLGDWSPNDTQIILNEGLSVNESRIHIIDAATGVAKRLLPEQNERTTYAGIGFSKDGKGIYAITNKDNEFNRLAYIELATKKVTYISTSIPWDVSDVDISRDGSKVAFVTNENGLSKLYILNTSNNKYAVVDKVPTGVIAGTKWSPDSKSLALTMVSFNSSADVYEYNTDTKDFIRWTESELGGMDVSRLQTPKLISWKSFDGKMISGFFYEAASNFTGKRPVIINIHGGPEGQAQPIFIGRSNYFLNELGVSIIYPNVRGSSGYGKTFLDLDNGMKREESVKDIGALLDWIAQQPNLDKDRVMVTGGSYGGYMTLASAVMYNDRIRCALDVVGISNFNTFLKNTESYRRDLRRVEYGDERDPAMAEFLEKISPLNHAEKITKPLFIVQGGNDPRVPHTEAVQVRDKVKQNGTEVWFLMANDEGHGFRKKNNVDFQFYATVEFIRRFLLK